MASKGNMPPETRDGEGKAAETGRATITTVATTKAEGGTGVEAKTEQTVGAETRVPNT